MSLLGVHFLYSSSVCKCISIHKHAVVFYFCIALDFDFSLIGYGAR